MQTEKIHPTVQKVLLDSGAISIDRYGRMDMDAVMWKLLEEAYNKKIYIPYGEILEILIGEGYYVDGPKRRKKNDD